MPRGVYPRKNKKPVVHAKTKKAAPKLKEPEVAEEFNPRETPETLRLDELTCLRLGKAQAELRAAESEVIIKQGVRTGLLQRVDPQGILKNLDLEIQRLTAARHEAARDYEEIKKTVEERYDIDLTKYSYDDKTGILHDISAKSETGTPPSSEEVLPTAN